MFEDNEVNGMSVIFPEGDPHSYLKNKIKKFYRNSKIKKKNTIS